ncbi:MAG: efflux RND transporter permease subunit [Gemmatimonadota bacterium]|nr:efflux RND transporter permease subunit [Gemmatimonadota bacterium]
MNIVDFAIRKPVTITMLVLAALIFGYVSFQRLAVNLLPDISYPSLTVRTEYEGAAPQEIENLISRRIEEDVGVVTGLVEVSSISRAGVSDVVLEFDWDTDMNLAIMDVRERVDRVFLPQDAERPILLRYNPELDPIMRLGLSGDDLIMLRNLADWEIRRQLETVPGVASVRIKGGLVEEIQVEINEAQLTRLGLTFGQINQRLAAENINQAGGQLQEGDEALIVRAVNEFQSVEEIGEIIISSRGEVPVRLHDVATVQRHFKERKTLTRINGRESVEIALFKEADANTVTVARAIRERLGDVEKGDAEPTEDAEPVVAEGTEDEATEESEETAAAGAESTGAGPGAAVMGIEANTIVSTLPEGVTLHLVSDQSRFIENAIDEVIKTAQWGGVLAILVLFLFLRNLRSTLIVGVAIPVSVLITFILMFFSQTTLNIMSLGGLALGIGMLVDNAIVVLESIFRCREEGDSMVEAARRGASEVGMAVTASTLTTIAVFFPIVFIEGIAGQIFTDQALTVTFALLASLAVALTFIPMMASREGSLGERAGRGLWVQSAFGDFRRTAAEERGGAIRWFAGRLVRDTVDWFVSTFPGLRRFVEIGQRFRQRGDDRPPTAASWILYFPVYLAGRIFVLAGHWLWGSVRQRPNQEVQAATNRWLRAAAWAPRWIFVFLYRLVLPVYRLVRFLAGSTFKILFTIVPNLLLVALVPAWFLLRGIFWVLGKVTQPILYVFNKGLEGLQSAYVSVLARALNQRFVTLLVVAAIVGTTMVLIPRLGTELIPEMEQGEFAVDLILPTGTPLDETDETATMIESLIREDTDIRQVYVVVGATESSGSLMDEERENVARVGVMLDAEAIRTRGSDPVMDRLRQRLADIPDARVEFVRPALFSFKAPLEVEIRGYNLKDLRGVSGEVVDVLDGLEGLRDVRSLMEAGYPEAVIVFDRDRMAALGVDIGQAADAIRNKVRGSVATRFSAGERKIDILVRAREEDRRQIAQLKAMAVNAGERSNTGQNESTNRNEEGEESAFRSSNQASSSRAQEGGPIQLGAVARVQLDEGPSEIRRIDQQRVALVTANLTGIDLGSVAGDMQERLAVMSLPDDFSIDIGGQYREMTIASRSMLLAIAMAVFLVYLVMASQFESLLHPFIIMISFLLALSGVLLTLYLLDIAISVIVLIGIIMLAGIVVNNAIVLVDYINQLRRRGIERIEAVITAGRVRLRPILMTSATTILGLLPLALGLGEGAEIRTPLAVTVIAGLIASTFLTLIVIPVIYSLVDRDQHGAPAEGPVPEGPVPEGPVQS